MRLPPGEGMDMRAYGFVEDRFRALRNDVSIQRMHSRLTAALQEEQARFMILAHYQFCDASEQASDPVPLSGAAILLHSLRSQLDCRRTPSRWTRSRSLTARPTSRRRARP